MYFILFCRCWSFEKTGRTWQVDGLNTTSYEKAEILNKKLFTLVDIGVISQKIRNVSIFVYNENYFSSTSVSLNMLTLHITILTIHFNVHRS